MMTTERFTVKLSLSEWVKVVVAIVAWTLGAYGFVDGIRDELTGRVTVLEEKAAAVEQNNERLVRIEQDIKQILQRLPR